MERRFVRRIELTGALAADSYLHDVPAVRYLEAAGRLEFHSDVTFLVMRESQKAAASGREAAAFCIKDEDVLSERLSGYRISTLS